MWMKDNYWTNTHYPSSTRLSLHYILPSSRSSLMPSIPQPIILAPPYSSFAHLNHSNHLHSIPISLQQILLTLYSHKMHRYFCISIRLSIPHSIVGSIVSFYFDHVILVSIRGLHATRIQSTQATCTFFRWACVLLQLIRLHRMEKHHLLLD